MPAAHRATLSSKVVLCTVPLGLPIAVLRINLKACRSVVTPPVPLKSHKDFSMPQAKGLLYCWPPL